MLSKRERGQLNGLVREHGYTDLVAELSAHAMREAHELEQEDEDPRQQAALVGQFAWIAELLGRCADELGRLE